MDFYILLIWFHFFYFFFLRIKIGFLCFVLGILVISWSGSCSSDDTPALIPSKYDELLLQLFILSLLMWLICICDFACFYYMIKNYRFRQICFFFELFVWFGSLPLQWNLAFLLVLFIDWLFMICSWDSSHLLIRVIFSPFFFSEYFVLFWNIFVMIFLSLVKGIALPLNLIMWLIYFCDGCRFM